MSNLPSKASESTHLSAERADHREWIGGRALTLLSHYWRDDDPVELTEAIGRDWADVLEGLSQDLIQRACIRYQQEESRRKPTPGAIYQLVKGMMPGPRVVLEADQEHFGPRQPRTTTEQAREILDRAGFTVNSQGRVGRSGTSLPEVLELVAGKLGVTIEDIKSPKRDHEIASVRRIYCVVARNQGQWSTAKIGREIHRDHTTVVHHCNAELTKEERAHVDDIGLCLKPSFSRSGYRFDSKRGAS